MSETMVQPQVRAFIPTYKEMQQLSEMTGLEVGLLAQVAVGLQQAQIVFAQIQPAAMAPVEEKDNGTTTESNRELNASLSAIASEFTDK